MFRRRKYLLVWLNSLGEVEEISYNEFKEYVYEDYLDGCKDMYEDVEMRDVGNGLISYLSDEFIIIKDIEDEFIDYEDNKEYL